MCVLLLGVLTYVLSFFGVIIVSYDLLMLHVDIKVNIGRRVFAFVFSVECVLCCV